VAATLQTPFLTDTDDPAIHVDATDGARSFVVTAVKNGGVRVYGLDGALRQTWLSAEDGRINNVDIAYDVSMADGSTADIVFGTDRGLDVIRFWRIDLAADEPLNRRHGPRG
jgi:3-phytase